MKNIFLFTGLAVVSFNLFAQQEETESTNEDTTRIRLKHMEILIVENSGSSATSDTVTLEPVELRRNIAHWAGVDFGFNVIVNGAGGQSFPGEPYLKNDIARSQIWNLNILEHKFKIVKEYVGLTTGLGFHFNQISFDNNYILGKNGDSTFALMDTVLSYEKNKLRATYLTVPLLLEFNTNKNNNRGFYFAAGVVGGLRIGSRYKTVHKDNGERVKSVQRGDYNLSPFKLDLTARLGYGSFGAFATYNLIPVFEDSATANKAHSLTAGITLNF